MLVEVAEGIENFLETVEKHSGKRIFALFCGGVSPATGESWCPDCVKAEPVIEKGVAKAPEDAVFIKCSVGDRATWKDPNCEFRKHPQLKLVGVPTLLEWNTPKRLVEEECSKQDLVDMFFEED